MRRPAQFIKIKNPDLIAMFQKQRGICYLCNGQMKLSGMETDNNLASIDHVYPRSKAPENFCVTKRASCKKCNSDKGDR